MLILQHNSYIVILFDSHFYDDWKNEEVKKKSRIALDLVQARNCVAYKCFSK